MHHFLAQIFGTLLPFILGILVLSVLATAARVLIIPRLKGWIGEALVNFWIRRRLDPSVYHLVYDVVLPTEDGGTTQIDHVIVSRYGIFVLETKNLKGRIFGHERQAAWTQVVFRRKYVFQNPLRQNYRHTKTLAALTGIPHEYFISVVIFVGDCTFKMPMPDNVTTTRTFIRFMAGRTSPRIRDEQVPEVVEAIRAWAETVDTERRKAHASRLRARFEAPPTQAAPERVQSTHNSTPTIPQCPRCGAAMAERTNRHDGSKFGGCTTFPQRSGIRKRM